MDQTSRQTRLPQVRMCMRYKLSPRVLNMPCYLLRSAIHADNQAPQPHPLSPPKKNYIKPVYNLLFGNIDHSIYSRGIIVGSRVKILLQHEQKNSPPANNCFYSGPSLEGEAAASPSPAGSAWLSRQQVFGATAQRRCGQKSFHLSVRLLW